MSRFTLERISFHVRRHTTPFQAKQLAGQKPAAEQTAVRSMRNRDSYHCEAKDMAMIVRMYHAQAELCVRANAPLASCIMVGASVEAMLTIIALIFFEKAIQTGNAPKYSKGKRKGETKELLDWKFFELLDVAKKLKWLPEELEPEHSMDPRPVKTPVRTDTIREVRNLVHPARYLKDRKGKEYTHEELRTLYATCHAVYTCLENKIYQAFPELRTA
jgi:hypothetical protein